jgi:AbrB family looped-hinge helix DNA binding protein
MDTTLDKFGRVVIPKPIRDALGLRAGDSLQVEPSGDAVVLKPLQTGSSWRRKGNVLVFTGTLTEDPGDLLRRLREERMRKLTRGGPR